MQVADGSVADVPSSLRPSHGNTDICSSKKVRARQALMLQDYVLYGIKAMSKVDLPFMEARAYQVLPSVTRS